MSDEEEVMCHKNDLCKHLNDLGYVDFETYEPHKKYQLCDNVKSLDFGSSIPSNSSTNNMLTSELAPIDSYNHDKIMSLLNSKLLFLEDVKFVESVLSLCSISDKKSVGLKFMGLIGAVATSFISITVYFNRGIHSYLPLSCAAMSCIYATWKLYKDKSESKRNKLVTSYVKSLQSVCVDFHKIIRFLKEVEILSTGQVSTQNIGSAMYIPVSSVKGLNKLPPWKTLPDLRKSVSDSLIDVINIFSSGCDYMSEFSPSWMDIQGFSSNSLVSVKPMKLKLGDIKTYDGCISIKDLQVLNDNYLLAQSEFLKWLAFYLCPAVWKNSKDKFDSFKNVILMKYLESTQSKICDVSLKLKLSFDLQKVFETCPVSKVPLEKTYEVNELSSVDLNELKELQVELHTIFLLVLSTVQKAKMLEDCLDTFSSKFAEEKYVPISELKDNLSHKLSAVRNDLEQVVKDYDYIYCKIINKKKSVNDEDRSVRTESNAYEPQNEKEEKIKVGYSNFAVSSPDEVFLAMSSSRPEDFEISSDDWWIEKQPKIPRTLLTELSTTLKPIKKEFEERERLVLKKLGFQDVEISDIEDNETVTPILNQNDTLNLTAGSTQRLPHKTGLDEPQGEGTSKCAESTYIQSEPSSFDNSLLMANLLKMNLLAKQRTNTDEECYSND